MRVVARNWYGVANIRVSKRASNDPASFDDQEPDEVVVSSLPTTTTKTTMTEEGEEERERKREFGRSGMKILYPSMRDNRPLRMSVH